jgi:hypothetical protein
MNTHDHASALRVRGRGFLGGASTVLIGAPCP